MTAKTQQHATKVVGDKVVWTNAKDENGLPVEPSADDLARLGPEQYKEYQQRVRVAREERAQARAEEYHRQQFEERFIAEGGSKSEAAAAWRRYRNETAEAAARRDDMEAHVSSHRRISSRL
jgi:hypothetical protein